MFWAFCRSRYGCKYVQKVKEEGGRSEYKSVGGHNVRLKEKEILASTVHGNNPMIYGSIENVFIFSLDKVLAEILGRGACWNKNAEWK